MMIVTGLSSVRINQSPSQSALDALRGYAEQLGEAVCKRAFDVALDNQIVKWSYIRAILDDKLSKGIQTLDDWDAQEKKLKAGKQMDARDQSDDVRKYIMALHSENQEGPEQTDGD